MRAVWTCSLLARNSPGLLRSRQNKKWTHERGPLQPCLRHGALQSRLCMARSKQNFASSARRGEEGGIPTGAGISGAWLDYGRIYGIQSVDQLIYESDVGNPTDIGSRLVDQEKNRRNLGLWLVLLKAQESRNGADGVKAIFRGMKYRGTPVKFAPHDPTANAIWHAFLRVGVEDIDFLHALCDHCLQNHFHRPELYSEVVGTLLQGRAGHKATEFSAKLRQSSFRGRDDLIRVFRAACRSDHGDALKHFCAVYKSLPNSHLYSEIMPFLWHQDRAADAFRMHSFLVARGDLPRTFEVLVPFVRYFAQQGTQPHPFFHSLDGAGASFQAQAHRLWLRERSRLTGLPGEALNIVASQTMGLQPQKLSDEFVARAFATTSLSFAFVVNSLRLLGLIEIGPLSVRQIAMTSPDIETLHARLEKLRELDIDTGSSALVRIVRNLCDQGNMEMLRLVIHSDQHHDVFEDLELQRRLLFEYYRSNDWTQVNRTLVILNRGRFGFEAQQQAANHLLRTAINLRDFDGVLNIMATMRRHGWRIIPTSFTSMLRTLLPRGPDGWAAVKKSDFDSVGFLIGVYQDALGSGNHIEMTRWREPIKALGKLGRFDELVTLVLWIAEWYRAEGVNKSVLSKPLFGKETDLNRLFDSRFQRAIIAWGMMTTPHSGLTAYPKLSDAPLQPWLQALKILQTLRDEYGVQVDSKSVKRAFTLCLRQLFLEDGVSRLARNRAARKRNRTPLQSYLALFSKLWHPDEQSHSLRRAVLRPARHRKGGTSRLEMCHGPRAESAHKETSTQRLADRPVTDHMHLDDGNKPLQDATDNVVMYRDLFNASWEDYRK